MAKAKWRLSSIHLFIYNQILKISLQANHSQYNYVIRLNISIKLIVIRAERYVIQVVKNLQ